MALTNGLRLTLPEHQCQVHVVSYIYRGLSSCIIWEERDLQSQHIFAIRQYLQNFEQNRIIWIDGRSHRQRAPPTLGWVFSTGKGEGGMLTVYTTHIKQGWVARNGLPSSDQATWFEHFIRHGNIFTHVTILTDPVYLTEPLIKSQTFNLIIPEGQNWVYPCAPVIEIPRPRGTVPHYLPGENPFVRVCADTLKAARGGAETMYREYQTN